jgi:hypothetical protein
MWWVVFAFVVCANAQSVTHSSPATSSTSVNTITAQFSISDPLGNPTIIQVVFVCTSGVCLSCTQSCAQNVTLTMYSNAPAPGPFTVKCLDLYNVANPFSAVTYPANQQMMNGYYTAYTQYRRPVTGTWLVSTKRTNVYVSVMTPVPLMYAPATGNASSTSIFISYLIQSPFTANSLVLTFFSASATVSLVLQNYVLSSSFSLSTSSLVRSPYVLSSTSNILPDGLYTVTMSYSDIYLHPANSVSAYNVLVQTVTPAPLLLFPSSNSFYPYTQSTAYVTYLLPSAPADASVSLTIVPGNYVYLLPSVSGRAVNFTLSVPLPLGVTYNYSLQYGDYLKNPVSSTQVTGVNLGRAPPPASVLNVTVPLSALCRSTVCPDGTIPTGSAATCGVCTGNSFRTESSTECTLCPGNLTATAGSYSLLGTPPVACGGVYLGCGCPRGFTVSTFYTGGLPYADDFQYWLSGTPFLLDQLVKGPPMCVRKPVRFPTCYVVEWNYGRNETGVMPFSSLCNNALGLDFAQALRSGCSSMFPKSSNTGLEQAGALVIALLQDEYAEQDALTFLMGAPCSGACQQDVSMTVAMRYSKFVNCSDECVTASAFTTQVFGKDETMYLPSDASFPQCCVSTAKACAYFPAGEARGNAYFKRDAYQKTNAAFGITLETPGTTAYCMQWDTVQLSGVQTIVIQSTEGPITVPVKEFGGGFRLCSRPCGSFCSVYSSCGRCTSNPYCSWCLDTGVCVASYTAPQSGVDAALSPGPSAWTCSSPSTTCPYSTCKVATDCASCLQRSNGQCGWCKDTAQCMDVSKYGQGPANGAWCSAFASSAYGTCASPSLQNNSVPSASKIVGTGFTNVSLWQPIVDQGTVLFFPWLSATDPTPSLSSGPVLPKWVSTTSAISQVAPAYSVNLAASTYRYSGNPAYSFVNYAFSVTMSIASTALAPGAAFGIGLRYVSSNKYYAFTWAASRMLCPACLNPWSVASPPQLGRSMRRVGNSNLVIMNDTVGFAQDVSYVLMTYIYETSDGATEWVLYVDGLQLYAFRDTDVTRPMSGPPALFTNGNDGVTFSNLQVWNLGLNGSDGGCVLPECPVDCLVGQWSAFGACSASCGGGTQRSNRSILIQPKSVGAACPSVTMTRDCNTQPCPAECILGSWPASGYTPCNVSCGGGSASQSRPVLQLGTDGCPGDGYAPCEDQSADLCQYRYATCNTQPCPVDCVVSGWVFNATCSVSCGVGVLLRSRSILTLARNGGVACPTELAQFVECNLGDCLPEPTPSPVPSPVPPIVPSPTALSNATQVASSSSFSTAAIIGVTLGSVLGLSGVIGLLVYCCVLKAKQK